MKKTIVFIFLFHLPFICIVHGKSPFHTILTNILNYDSVGFIEVIDGKISNRLPLIVPADGYMYIYPYDLFIKIYDKDTGNEYFTRNLHDLTGHFTRSSLEMDLFGNYVCDNWIFVPGPNEGLSISMNDYSNANRIYIEKKGTDYYFIVACLSNEDVIPFINIERNNDIIGDKEIIIDEIKITFYRSIGEIKEPVINNIYFEFEKVEEVVGDIIFGYANLSNVDLLKNINVIKYYIENNLLDTTKSFEYYLELLKKVENNIENNGINSIYDPLNIKNILEELLFIQ